MKDALKLPEGNSVKAAEYEALRPKVPVNALVCPECYWQVTFVGEGDGRRAYFKHASLPGAVRWKACSRYMQGGDGGPGPWTPPDWLPDDHPTIQQVLNGFVIHQLAARQSFFGADSRSYGLAKAQRPHALLLPDEARWTDLIVGAAESSSWGVEASIAEQVFVKYLAASAQRGEDPPRPIKLSPFHQLMALAWSSAGNRLRALFDALEDGRLPSPAVAEWRHQFALLTGGARGARPPAPSVALPTSLRRLLGDALRTAGLTDAPVVPVRVAMAAVVVNALLGIVTGLEIDRLLTEPAKLFPKGGYIYIAAVYRQAHRPIGVKVGKTKRMPERRQAEHFRNSIGSIERLDIVRFVVDRDETERRFIAELNGRGIACLLSPHGREVKGEVFDCSVGIAYAALNRVLAQMSAQAEARDEDGETEGAST